MSFWRRDDLGEALFSAFQYPKGVGSLVLCSSRRKTREIFQVNLGELSNMMSKNRLD